MLPQPLNGNTQRCEICGKFDTLNNLDWVSKKIGKVEFVVFGHIPETGCNKEK
jgi:hypothetical protein